MDRQKVEAVTWRPQPTSLKLLKSFLWFANFYWRLIQGLFSRSVSHDPPTRTHVFTFLQRLFGNFHGLLKLFTTASILPHPGGHGGGSDLNPIRSVLWRTSFVPHSLENQLNLRHMPTSSTSPLYVSRRLWSGRILCQSLDIPTPQFPQCAYVGIFIGLSWPATCTPGPSRPTSRHSTSAWSLIDHGHT